MDVLFLIFRVYTILLMQLIKAQISEDPEEGEKGKPDGPVPLDHFANLRLHNFP